MNLNFILILSCLETKAVKNSEVKLSGGAGLQCKTEGVLSPDQRTEEFRSTFQQESFTPPFAAKSGNRKYD